MGGWVGGGWLDQLKIRLTSAELGLSLATVSSICDQYIGNDKNENENEEIKINVF